MNKKIVKKDDIIADGDYVGYSFICEKHYTKKDEEEILRKIVSIKNTDGVELISEISLSMRNHNSDFERLLRDVFKTMGVGVDQHIMPRTLIRNWNIVINHDQSNLTVINRENKYKKIHSRKNGYKKFMSKDFYFVKYDVNSIVILETGFIGVFDTLLTNIRNEITQSTDFNELLETENKNKLKCFLIDVGNPFYNKLIFLYFFHWAISHTYEKSQEFISVLSDKSIDYDSVDNIISHLVYHYREQLEKYIGIKNMFIVKIDEFYNIETPLGNLFSLNLYNRDINEHFSVSPLSPSHYLVLSNNLHETLQVLSVKENLELFIKEYILQNIVGFYDKNFTQFVYKSFVAKKYLDIVFDTVISDLAQQVNLDFPNEYYGFTLRELIEADKLDISKFENINLKYDDI